MCSHACVHKGISVPRVHTVCTPAYVPMHSVCLLKPGSGVTAVLQLCHGCEKPSMTGEICSYELCNGSGTKPKLPPLFFPQRGVVESMLGSVGVREQQRCREAGQPYHHRCALLGGYATTSSFPRPEGCHLKGVGLQYTLFSVHFTIYMR